ncbi:uncharacterized protein LOC135369772 [Ornithodoros turicata]|uniref:uncharacterized protein LOC135369772 n=1 Tax=Ornithodoros turicata TaxID=34597 RepID=UPI003139D109
MYILSPPTFEKNPGKTPRQHSRRTDSKPNNSTSHHSWPYSQPIASISPSQRVTRHPHHNSSLHVKCKTLILRLQLQNPPSDFNSRTHHWTPRHSVTGSRAMAHSRTSLKYDPLHGLDSRWSWIMAGFCSWVMFTGTLSNRVSGVIYYGIIETFQVSREEASWPVTLSTCCFSLAGPAMGYLCRRFSCRVVVMTCALVTGIGVMVCYFAPNLLFINIFFGVVHAPGEESRKSSAALRDIGEVPGGGDQLANYPVGYQGIASSTPLEIRYCCSRASKDIEDVHGLQCGSNVVVAQHFQKKQTTACTVVFTACGLNTLFIPRLAEFFRSHYGVRGTFLLLGALIANTFPAAIAIRSPPWALPKKSTPNSVQKARGKGPALKSHAQTKKIADEPDATHLLNLPNGATGNSIHRQIPPAVNWTGSMESFSIPLPDNRETTPDPPSLQETLRNFTKMPFFVDAFSFAILIFALTTFILLSVDLAKDRGIAPSEAVYLLYTFCAGDIIFRGVSGYVIDSGLLSLEAVMCFGYLLQAAVYEALVWCGSLPTLLLCSVFLGVSNGCRIGLQAPTLVNDFGVEVLPIMMGGMTFVIGVVSLIRPRLIGYYRDLHGKYDGLLHIVACANVLFTFVWSLKLILRRRSQRTAKHVNTVTEENPSQRFIANASSRAKTPRDKPNVFNEEMCDSHVFQGGSLELECRTACSSVAKFVRDGRRIHAAVGQFSIINLVRIINPPSITLWSDSVLCYREAHSADMEQPGKMVPAEGTEHEPASQNETGKNGRKRRTIAPDCAWSWVVAVSCAMMNFFSVVMIRSAGVVYVQIVDYFGVTREQAAWPVSIVPGVANLIGPVVALLIRKVGIRPVTITGTFLSGTSVILSYFAPDVLTLSIILGVFHGVGLGMTFTPNAVCLNEWFDKKKVRAAGIIYTGATLGSFAFPVLIKACNEAFGFRGCFLVIGALMLHGTAFALLLRSPPWMAKRRQAKRKSKEQKLFSPASGPQENKGFDNDHETEEQDKTNVQIYSLNHPCIRKDNCTTTKEQVKSILPVRTFTHSSVKRKQERCGRSQQISSDSSTTDRPSYIRSVSDEVPDMPDMPDIIESSRRERSVSETSHASNEPQPKRRVHRVSESSTDEAAHREGHRKRSSSVSSSLSNLYCIYEPAAHTNTVNVIPESEESSQSSRESFSGDQEKRPSNKKKLLSPVYVLVCLTYIFVTNSNMAFMTVIMDFAHDRGIPLKKAVYLLSAYALCDVTGRLSIGWVTDKGLLGRRTTMAMSCVTLGISFQALPFFNTFEGLLAMCLILGYSVGNTVVLFTVILADAVGLEKLPMAMGIMTFFAGMSGFTRPTLIGFFRDEIGSYDNMLRSLGAVIICLGMSWTVLRLLENSRTKQFDVKNEEKTSEQPQEIYIIR